VPVQLEVADSLRKGAAGERGVENQGAAWDRLKPLQAVAWYPPRASHQQRRQGLRGCRADQIAAPSWNAGAGTLALDVASRKPALPQRATRGRKPQTAARSSEPLSRRCSGLHRALLGLATDPGASCGHGPAPVAP